MNRTMILAVLAALIATLFAAGAMAQTVKDEPRARGQGSPAASAAATMCPTASRLRYRMRAARA